MPLDQTDNPADEDEEEKKPKPRAKDLLGRRESPCRRYLEEVFDQVKKGFENQNRRSDDIEDWWDCFFCKLDNNQFYNGNASLYVPIIRDAITARATRFVNQLFPNSGRFVEVVSADGKQPADIIALLDHYIRKRKLKNKIAKPLSIHGDVEGQYNLYVDWWELARWVMARESHGPVIEQDGSPVETEGEEIEDIGLEEIWDGGPGVEVLHDSDVAVLPTTADSVEEALERGGCVAIVRRWTKADIKQKIDDGEINKAEGEELLEKMRAMDTRDIEKKLNEQVGITSRGETAHVWEVWKKLPLSDAGFSEKGEKRLCRVWYGPDKAILGCKRNPYWNDLCPLLSEPPIKVAGQFKGQSIVEPVAPLQYAANDAANEGEDSRHYAAMPLMRVSPNVTQPIILNLGAILRAEQGELEMIQFPDLSARQLTAISAYTTQIFQTLGVNPAMLPQQSGRPGAKRNQAEIAMEQQVDLLTTAEAVSVMGDMFTDLMGWFVDLDHQFRDRPLTLRKFGTLGKHAEMEEINPIQNRARYTFTWIGSEAAKNAAMFQQQIGYLNVLRQMRPELQAEGYMLKIGPLLENSAMAIFGAMTGANVIEDMRHMSSLDPELENQLLNEGHQVPVMPLDQDVQHIQAHQKAAAQSGDPFGNFKIHIAMHMAQMQQKMQVEAQQAMQQQMRGRAGGRQGRPGPRQGAQPAMPRAAAQQPPGAIRPDAMPRAGVVPMPRRM